MLILRMHSCRGKEVWFLKRAQIFAGDVWGAFQVRPDRATRRVPILYHAQHSLKVTLESSAQ